MNRKILNDLFKLFLEDLRYIQSFISENFSKKDVLLNKNKGKFLSQDYSIKNSRIKGFGFHGYGCLFQFKDFYIDVDLRFDKIGFTTESFYRYVQKKKHIEDFHKLKEFLELQVDLKLIDYDSDDIYLIL